MSEKHRAQQKRRQKLSYRPMGQEKVLSCCPIRVELLNVFEPVIHLANQRVLSKKKRRKKKKNNRKNKKKIQPRDEESDEDEGERDQSKVEAIAGNAAAHGSVGLRWM